MRSLPVAVVVALTLVAGTARADPLVEQAKEAYLRADFEEAVELLELAEGAAELSRDDLIEILLTRAMVRFALDDPEGMNGDLRALASLDPEHDLPADVPPSVREAFGRVGAGVDEGLRLTAAMSRTERGVLFEITVENDLAGLVRRTQISCRVDGGAPARGSGTSFDVTAEAGAAVLCRAQAYGPGRAVLADVERDVMVSRHVEAGALSAEGGMPAWPFVVGGVVIVAAAVAIIVALVLGGQSEQVVRGPSPEM